MKDLKNLFFAHRKEKNRHNVIVGLKVLITENDGLWSAQSLEIDYATSGTSLEDVKQRFVTGLTETIKVYLDKFDSLDKFIRQAPESEWIEFMKTSKQHHLAMECLHIVPEDNEFSEFINQVNFFEPKIAA